AITYKSKPASDTAKKVVKDFFQNEFEDEKLDTTKKLNTIPLFTQPKTSTLSKSKLFDYSRKFNADYALVGFSNNILINRYQPYAGGSGPI
ncbi:hypothetical protein ACI394_28455, partial [Klebsiella pneumoniae]|uniref:hypothetical protein n=1 Tax=Klebsiella pneumoniae TaxID=573 RepID=UPI0038520A1C